MGGIDKSGNAYLTGLTSSTKFPLMKSGVAGTAIQRALAAARGSLS